jgi:predicted nucleic acid-binding protein
MSGNKSAVLDSNIVILLSKGMANIDSILKSYNSISVSIITYMEVKGYSKLSSAEEKLIDAFFDNIQVADVTKELAEIVVTYRKDSKKKIKIPDAIVLATAKYLQADLITNNISDFKGIDKRVNLVALN